MANIPLLTADDVECRIQSVNKGKSGKVGAILLIYKNARVDMRILDEVYGADNWQRTHEVINGNLFCNIDIWDAEKKCWVRKQDVGTESNTEAEKGEASDAFKRAGFCVGIGRELYTAPFIWIELKDGEYFEDEKTRKPKAYQTLKFRVTEIGYDDKRRIDQLIICDSKGNARYTMTARHPISAGLSGKPKDAPKEEPKPKAEEPVAKPKAKPKKAVKEEEPPLPPLPEPYDEDAPPEQIPLPFEDGTAVYCAECGHEITPADTSKFRPKGSETWVPLPLEKHIALTRIRFGQPLCRECAEDRQHVNEMKAQKVGK